MGLPEGRLCLVLLWMLGWAQRTGSECPSCGGPTLAPQAERALILQLAKQQILEGLHLTSRPKIPHPLPRAALTAALRRLQPGSVAAGNGEEIISFATVTGRCGSERQAKEEGSGVWREKEWGGVGLAAEEARQSLLFLKTQGGRESDARRFSHRSFRSVPSPLQAPQLHLAAPCSPSTCPRLDPTTFTVPASGCTFSPPCLALST